MKRKLALRQFVELVFAGKSKIEAYGIVNNRPHSSSDSAQASRWWKHPEAEAHRLRLKGALQPEVVTVPMEVARAQRERDWFIGCLEDTITTSPFEIMATLIKAESLEEACKLLTPAQNMATEGLDITVTFDKDGNKTITYKVKQSSKSHAKALLAKCQGFDVPPQQVKELSGGIAAKIRASLKDTTKD